VLKLPELPPVAIGAQLPPLELELLDEELEELELLLEEPLDEEELELLELLAEELDELLLDEPLTATVKFCVLCAPQVLT
jgi:hypothetical protein